jgi:hypothetical protein
VLDTGEIRGKRHDHRGNGARALQRAAGDCGPDVGGGGGKEAAAGEDSKADIDDALAAPPVRRDAERNLQHGLRQAVGAERDSN